MVVAVVGGPQGAANCELIGDGTVRRFALPSLTNGILSQPVLSIPTPLLLLTRHRKTLEAGGALFLSPKGSSFILVQNQERILHLPGRYPNASATKSLPTSLPSREPFLTFHTQHTGSHDGGMPRSRPVLPSGRAQHWPYCASSTTSSDRHALDLSDTRDGLAAPIRRYRRYHLPQRATYLGTEELPPVHIILRRLRGQLAHTPTPASASSNIHGGAASSHALATERSHSTGQAPTFTADLTLQKATRAGHASSREVLAGLAGLGGGILCRYQ